MKMLCANTTEQTAAKDSNIGYHFNGFTIVETYDYCILPLSKKRTVKKTTVLLTVYSKHLFDENPLDALLAKGESLISQRAVWHNLD